MERKSDINLRDALTSLALGSGRASGKSIMMRSAKLMYEQEQELDKLRKENLELRDQFTKLKVHYKKLQAFEELYLETLRLAKERDKRITELFER